MKSKSDIRKAFENGDKPRQEHFWEWQDSYWHKEDPQDIIPANRVDLSAKADLINGKVPAEQLPGFVDDILEFETLETFPAEGESGKLFLAKNTNKLYRWSGSQYVDVTNAETNTLDIVVNKGNYSSKPILFAQNSNIGDLGYNSSTKSYFFGNMNPNHTGTNNLAVGENTLASITTGHHNTALGHLSLQSLTSGIENVSIGWETGMNLTTGKYNSLYGDGAGKKLTTAERNVFIGDGSGCNATGNKNVFIGQGAGNLTTGGSENIFIGQAAGARFGSGTSESAQWTCNILIGAGIASWTPSTYGSNNVIIGSYAAVNGSLNNTLIIDSSLARTTNPGLVTPFLMGNFVEKTLTLDTNLKVNRLPNSTGNTEFNRIIISKPDGTFGWEEKKAQEVNISKSASFPANAAPGDLFFNTGDNKHYGFDGTNWNVLY